MGSTEHKPQRKQECVCGEINTRHCPVHGQGSNQHSEPLASGSVATDSGSTGGGAYSEPLADATYFGDGHAFTVAGDPEQLDKMAAYISELKCERAGLIEQLDTERHQNELLGDANETLATRNAALVEQLEAHRTFADHFLEWCESVAAEEDSPIHKLVAEAQALGVSSPAKRPTCPKCGRDLHGFRGPLCRYCDPEAECE